MIKVLRIINRFNLGGPTYNAAYLTRYLPPDYETLLLGGLKDDSEESSEFILNNLGINYRIIPEMKREVNIFNDLRAYKIIEDIIIKWKPDIIHTHAAKAGFLGRLAAYRHHVPVIVHTFHGHVFHSYFSSFKTSVYKNIERSMARRSSAIIAISRKQKEELASVHRICPAEKIQVIPLGFDLQRFNDNKEDKRKKFREKYNLHDSEIAIGIVGRLVPVKNHALFIEAVRQAKEHSKEKIKAFIIGDGEERNTLADMVKRLGLNETVVFTSWEKEVDKVYPGLDIVCLSSFNEGTPVSLIEAQAAGKPIVSTSTGGIEDIVIPGKTGLLSGVTEKALFINNLLALISDADLRKKMGEAGWNQVCEKFHYTRLVREMQALYDKLLYQVKSR